jgi:broad specificity phosphatase PhoE
LFGTDRLPTTRAPKQRKSILPCCNASPLFDTTHLILRGCPDLIHRRAAGCSFDEFLELMRQDDELDSQLTDLGRTQAEQVYASFKHSWKDEADADNTAPFDLVVSSPLSRTLHTADLALPPALAANRVAYESFREINGWLLNAKRRSKNEVGKLFPHWNFEQLSTEEDCQWTEVLETSEACRERGYQGFKWILERPESRVFLVSHGGILRYTMEFEDKVVVNDERTSSTERTAKDRFENCEVRRYRLELDESVSDESRVVLTEIDLEATSEEVNTDEQIEIAQS